MRSNYRWALVLGFVLQAFLNGRVPAQDRTDIAQWDFDGSLDSSTGQPPLLELGAADIQFESVDFGGAPADVGVFTRGTYLRVLHGFPSNGGGVYVNQYTLIMDVMFPDRTPSNGEASLLQTNCCNMNDGDWFIDPDGALGIFGSFGGLVEEGVWYRLALVVDLVAGTYISYINGVEASFSSRPANGDLALDGRFSLYSPTDPDPEDFFYIFADDSGQDAEGLVNSVQFRDVALPASEIAKLGGPSAEGIKKPDLVLTRALPGSIQAGGTFTVSLELVTFAAFTNATIRERIPRYWTAANPSAPGRIDVDAEGRQTLIWELTGGVGDQTLTYSLTAPNPFANVSFKGSTAEADGQSFNISGDTKMTGGTEGFATEALAVVMKQPTTACAGNNPGLVGQAQDYLDDGDAVREITIAPAQGDSVSPDFLVSSPSPGAVGPTSLTWTRIAGPLFQINDCDDCMGYLAFYAENTTGETLKVSVASASDDGEQILIDGKQVWNNSVPRGSGAAQVQDRSPLFDLAPGKHLVLQKVFEGCGGFDSAIRFEDSDQNPIVGPIPGGPIVFSLDPSGYEGAKNFVLRDIPNSLDVGEAGTVTLRLRVKDALTGATIEENVPAGFAISDVSGGGAVAGQKITWTIAGALSDRNFTYRVTLPDGTRDGTFAGTANLGGESEAIVGDLTFNRGVMNDAGFIKHWLVLGPFDTLGVWTGDTTNPPADLNATSATPENGDLHLDFLTDGTTTEKNIRPFDGMRILPDFLGSAGDGINSSKAVGLEPLARTCAPETPTWERFVSATGTFNNADYFGMAVISQTTYAAAYVTNTTGAAIQAVVAIDSDDAFIASLDGNEIIAYEPAPCSATDCGRGVGAEDTVVNTAPVTITPGEHFLLTRVHNGLGNSGHRLRFQDGQGAPILNDKLVVRTKSISSPPAVYVSRILSGEAYRSDGPPLVVTLRVEATGIGNHDVAVREVLPEGWSAEEISNSGAQVGSQVSWNLTGFGGTVDLTYKIVPGDCAVRGSWCGNGVAASEYTVDGGKTHALRGETAVRRDARGTDDLGSWDVRDIGYSGGGAQRVDDHGVDVLGKGGGVKLAKDEFRFISQPATGDAEISTKIDCLDDPGQLGQAGLMVRDTFDTFSAHVFFFLTPEPPGGATVASLKGLLRKQTNATQKVAPISFSNSDVTDFPVYLKVKRAGAKLSFHRSSDGVNYTEVASRDIGTGNNQVNLRNETLMGLATSAGGGGATLAAYREVSFPPLNPPFTSVPPEAPALTGATGGANQVSLTWTAPATGPAPTAYEIHRASSPGGAYSLLVEVPATDTSYVDTGLAANTQYCYQLKSRRASSTSAFSNELCATTQAGGVATFRRGDADANGTIDITDPIRLLNYLFSGGQRPECMDAADFDDDGIADISDSIANLGFQFLGGPPPTDPGPQNCGPDRNQEPAEGKEELGCTVSCG